MQHIVYVDAKAKELQAILEGYKTMILRGATGRKLPHGRVFAGETLYFVENNGSGLLCAQAIVKSVLHSEKLTEEESQAMIAAHMDKLRLTDAQVKRFAGKRYLCLVELQSVKSIKPLILNRQSNMDDWITVENISSVLQGADEKYESIRIK